MKKHHILIIVLFVGFSWQSCSEDDSGELRPAPVVHDLTPYDLNVYSFPQPILPNDNPLTEQGVKLGKMLFYEPMLSKNNILSCASCHNQETAFSDTARFSIGVEGLPGTRQAMAVFNMAWNLGFFWDGRAHTLREQSLIPIQDSLEMNESLENVVSKLSSSQLYIDQFKRAFGTSDINEDLISLALEQFMFTIVTANSKYDRYVSGLEEFSESELRGLTLFEANFSPSFPDNSGANCDNCHGGINFENGGFINNGLDSDGEFLDIGREGTTGNPEDRATFKVPTLRNIALTPPYMHDGRFATLEEVIDHYNEGIHPSSTLNNFLESTRETGLQLTTQDKTDLVNFLKTLTDEEFLVNPEYASPF